MTFVNKRERYNPCSSPEKKINKAVEGGGKALNTRAISNTAAAPLPLSSAPFKNFNFNYNSCLF